MDGPIGYFNSYHNWISNAETPTTYYRSCRQPYVIYGLHASRSMGGVSLGLITPLIAVAVGIMQRPEMVPVIMIGNAVLVVVFSLFRGQTPQLYKTLLGVVFGSALKYGVFAVAIAFILQLPQPVAQTFGVTQLFTALSGGVLAMIMEKALKKTELLQH